MPKPRRIGERNSAQRDRIARVIHEAGGPLTVQEILARARREIANLGIATVYRNVKLLLEASQVRSIVLSDGRPRYEAMGRDHHHHFRCRSCGRVFDFSDCPISLKAPSLPGGFKIEAHDVTLHGICARCTRNAGGI